MQLKIKQLLLASLLGAVAGGSKTTVSPIYGVDAAAADFAQGAERILSFALAKSGINQMLLRVQFRAN